jgi:hypothetical protein
MFESIMLAGFFAQQSRLAWHCGERDILGYLRLLGDTFIGAARGGIVLRLIRTIYLSLFFAVGTLYSRTTAPALFFDQHVDVPTSTKVNIIVTWDPTPEPPLKLH